MAGGREDADVLDRPPELHRRAGGGGGAGRSRDRDRLRSRRRRTRGGAGARQRPPPQGGSRHRRRRGGLAGAGLARSHAVVQAIAGRRDPAAGAAHRGRAPRSRNPELHRVLVGKAAAALHPGVGRGGLSRPARPGERHGGAAHPDRCRAVDPVLPASRRAVPAHRRSRALGSGSSSSGSGAGRAGGSRRSATRRMPWPPIWARAAAAA